MELWTFLQVSILRSDIILLEQVFPFFLVAEGSASMMSLHSSYYSLSLNCRHLFFETSLHSSLLVGDYVCGLSYKSNTIVWLETFYKEYLYWQVLMHKIYATTFTNTTFIHISLKLSRFLPSLPGQDWDCALNPIC